MIPLLGNQSEQGYLGGAQEANRQHAGAQPAVDVKRDLGPACLIETGDKGAGKAGQVKWGQQRYPDLPAMGVPGQHQVDMFVE